MSATVLVCHWRAIGLLGAVTGLDSEMPSRLLEGGMGRLGFQRGHFGIADSQLLLKPAILFLVKRGGSVNTLV